MPRLADPMALRSVLTRMSYKPMSPLHLLKFLRGYVFPALFLSFLCGWPFILAGCDDTTQDVQGGDPGGELIAGEMAGAVGGGVGGDLAGALAGGMQSMMAGATPAGEIAGEVAGEVAGMMMGGDELPAVCLERPSPPPQSDWRQEALCQAQGEGLKIRHLRDPRCPRPRPRCPLLRLLAPPASTRGLLAGAPSESGAYPMVKLVS